MKRTSAIAMVSDFLKSLKIGERSPSNSPVYDELSLSKEIVNHLNETRDITETIDFLDIFSLGDELCKEIGDFLKKDPFLSIYQSHKPDKGGEDSALISDSSDELDSTESDSEATGSDEYFDELEH